MVDVGVARRCRCRWVDACRCVVCVGWVVDWGARWEGQYLHTCLPTVLSVKLEAQMSLVGR